MSTTRFLKRLLTGTALIAAAITASAQDKHDHSHPHPHAPAAPATPAVDKPAPTGDQPKLVLSMTEWDFGTKWYGEKCEGLVSIKNEGKAPLTIINVKTSCGCTAAKPKSGGTWQNKVLQPGESDELTLSYSTRKAPGKVTQTVTIESNDPVTPSLPFQVKGEVKQLFTMAPADRVTFPKAEKDVAESQTVELTSNMPDKAINLKLKPVDEKSRYDVKLETVEDGKKFKLTATTKPPLENGANALEVVLETGMEQFPEVRIPVTAFVSPRVSVAPNKLFVSSKATATVQRKVRMMYNASKPTKIVEIKCDPPTLKAELAPASVSNPTQPQAQGVHDLNVTLPIASDLPGGKGTITILTDDPSPEYQRLTIDVQVRDTAPVARPVTVGPPAPVGTPPVKPGAPAQPAKPVEPVKPADGAKPAEGAKP